MGSSAGNGGVCVHELVHEVLLGEAFEHAPMGAFVLDERGGYVAVNRRACELTGYEREELLELGAAGISADVATLPGQLGEMTSGTSRGGFARIRCKDGLIRCFGFRTGPTRAAGLPFFLAIFWESDAVTV